MLPVLHGDSQFEADLGKPGLLRVTHQVTVIEVQHGIIARRLDGFV